MSAYLNSTALFVFFMGIYTVIFFWTIHSYLRRKQDINCIIIAAITALYAENFAQLCLQWHKIQPQSAQSGLPRLTTLVGSGNLSGLPLETLFSALLQYSGYVLANGLTVWRCFKMHGRFSKVLAVPLCLFFVEIVLVITASTIAGLMELNAHYMAITNNGRLYNILDATLSITTATTSSITTFLICYRIHTNITGVQHFALKNRYRSVMRMLIDSSMIYSIVVFIGSILSFIDPGDLTSPLWLTTNIAQQFIVPIVAITSGLAPTFMVARVTMYAKNEMEETSTVALPSDLISSAHPGIPDQPQENIQISEPVAALHY